MTNWNPARRRFTTSQAAERDLAARLGGRALPRSGGVQVAPGVTFCGDLRTDLLNIEHKRTEKDRISVPFEWLVKVAFGASKSGRRPALAILFEGVWGPAREFLWLPLPYFQHLTQCADSPERFHGVVREVKRRSFTLRAEELVVIVSEAGDRMPTYAMVWEGVSSSKTPCTWVGAPVECLQPLIREAAGELA